MVLAPNPQKWGGSKNSKGAHYKLVTPAPNYAKTLQGF